MDDLERWHGSSAELWSYSTSHSRLVVKLRSEAGAVFIVMEDVRGVWGAVAWPCSRLRAVRDDANKEWIVRDSEAGFFVTCGLARMTADNPSR